MTLHKFPPLVSVILPVYNCPTYIEAAIESVLTQTFTDFELLIIDDGSTDSTPQILQKFLDPRIQIVTQTNQGLAATLNKGIELARGKYIARQDQDDISLPERFAKQVDYLETHSQCALLGTWAEIWQERLRTERVHRHPVDNSTLKFELLFNNLFVHSSVMLRKVALEKVGGYCTDRNRQPPEDYELWSRIARQYEIANIPEVLHIYREIPRSMSRNGPSPFLEHLVTISAENIAWASGDSKVNSSVQNIAAIVHGATHHIKTVPNFIAMRNTLRRAVIRVVSPDEQIHFLQEADSRLVTWWFSYLQNHYKESWVSYLLAVARRSYYFYQAFKQIVLRGHK